MKFTILTAVFLLMPLMAQADLIAIDCNEGAVTFGSDGIDINENPDNFYLYLAGQLVDGARGVFRETNTTWSYIITEPRPRRNGTYNQYIFSVPAGGCDDENQGRLSIYQVGSGSRVFLQGMTCNCDVD